LSKTSQYSSSLGCIYNMLCFVIYCDIPIVHDKNKNNSNQ
jgi:hypothetical protein